MLDRNLAALYETETKALKSRCKKEYKTVTEDGIVNITN